MTQLDSDVVAEAFAGRMLPLSGSKDKVRRRVERGGEIDVLSGRVLAYEPFFPPSQHRDDGTWSQTPLAQRVPKGGWPVDVALTEIGPGHDRVAFVRLSWSSSPAAYWINAPVEGRSLENLREGYIYGYPVDGGMGGFIDWDVAMHWRESVEKKVDPELLEHPDLEPMMRNAADYALITLRDPPHHRFAVVSAGWGDGFYPTYVGHDVSGEPVAFLTDFGLLTE